MHDVAYDFYGRHVATCSSDQHVKVFRLDRETGQWIASDSWKAHDSSVVSIDWAAPEYGRLLASASHDKTVKLWEEDLEQPELSGRRWNLLCTLNDSHGALYTAKFAPAHCGLKLATVGSDGLLRIYEALEPADLRSWTLTAEIKLLPQPPETHLQSAFTLDWCPSRFSREKLVVSALDQAWIYENTASAGGPINTEFDGKLAPSHAGEELRNSNWVAVAKLPGHQGLIRSSSWAPSIGRWHHLIATGCKDGIVRIFKVEEPQSAPLRVELIGEHDDHMDEVWSVSWNLTGTILSSAGNDGKVRLWKSTYSNEFKCMSVINAKQSQ